MIPGRKHLRLTPEPWRFVHYNLLSSTTQVADQSGTVIDDELFYPWGQQWKNAGTTNDLHFATMSTEQELWYTVGRRYSGTDGRWLSPDPVGGHTEDPQTLNKYAYARNNPLTLTDPTGLDFYLSCQEESNTCQKDAAGNLVQGTTTTTTATDTNGNTTSTFNPTVVTSASLEDPNSGNTAVVNANGVQITTAQGTAEGIFINGTPDATIQDDPHAAGFSDFVFHVFGSDERTGNLDYGTYTYKSSRDQADVIGALNQMGAFSYPGENQVGNPFHRGELNFRFSSGAHPEMFDYGPSPHLLVREDPRATVPVGPGYAGGFHVDSHTGSLSHGACAFLHVGCQ